MDKSDPKEGDPGAPPEWANAAIEAIDRAAARLDRSPAELAHRLQDGLIADLVEELELARRLMPYPTDATRIARLLEQLRARPSSRDGHRAGG